MAAAAAAWLADQRRRDEASAAERGDPWSPWAMGDGWRIDGTGHHDIEFDLNARRLRAKIRPSRREAFASKRLRFPLMLKQGSMTGECGFASMAWRAKSGSSGAARK